MENTEGRELLENVTISNVNESQYMIQRVPVVSPQLLSTELLQHHNGLVVDLGAGDFIPVNYTSEDLLSQDLTEEDRNLAAALVAVQLSQQQKQQQLQDSNVIINTSLPSLVSGNSLDDGKVNLSDQQLMLNDKGGISNGYLQIVETDSIYKQSLMSKISSFDTRDFPSHSVYSRNQELLTIKAEEELETVTSQQDSDGEAKSDNRSSKKSLPHKKRISRKLKKTSAQTLRRVYRCNLCEQIFSNSNEFGTHQNLCQTTITPIHQAAFICQICNGSFQDQLRFFEHLKSHYEPDVIIQVSHSPEAKTKQMSSKQTKSDNLITTFLTTCIQCNKTFRRQKAYEAHMRDFHSKDDLNEFSEPEDLMAGIDVNTSVQNTVNDTKDWYNGEDELQATEEDLRQLEAQEYICHVCMQTFSLRTTLQEHMLTCKMENEGSSKKQTMDMQQSEQPKKKAKKKATEYHCSECSRVFMHKNSLVYHMRGHTGIRPHPCNQCGKSFFAASALKVHLRLHSGDKPYRCEYCGRYFRQWGDLKYHCVSIHSDQKQYQCEYCGKDFARKYSLIVHRRIHTGEKNYKCEFCGKTFRASSYLQNHRRIHTGEKPHPCELCGKRFRVRSDMKRHFQTHNRKRLVPPGSPDALVTKIEHFENEGIESILPDEESDGKYKDEENAIPPTAIQYEAEGLENVREGNTLYVMPILIS
ncbi:zinc finger protein [Oryctes borbonicus]|uniref:Zinc finger protein n=1 Tax=Oryctes borbonicus TaxID=1629725 RepID=A0A0T6AYC8_9SCAR|nr:zinc finger protein [Oryctes borbonicus]